MGYTRSPLSQTAAVVAVAVGRLSDKQIIASYADKADRGIIDDLKNALYDLTDLTMRQFYTFELGMHAMHFRGDSGGRIYFMVTLPDYPPRVASRALERLQSTFLDENNAGDFDRATPDGLSKKNKRTFKALVEEFEDFEGEDHLTDLQSKVDGITNTMQSNLQRALSNHESITTLETESDMLSQHAKLFNKQSRDLHRHMRCKNIKVTIIIVLVVTAVLAAFIVPFAVKESEKN